LASDAALLSPVQQSLSIVGLSLFAEESSPVAELLSVVDADNLTY
jgi:hypothetical protein